MSVGEMSLGESTGDFFERLDKLLYQAKAEKQPGKSHFVTSFPEK